MVEWMDPAGIQAIFAGFIGFVSGMAVAVAFYQLRQISRSNQIQALQVIYSYIDQQDRRDDRRAIHSAIEEGDLDFDLDSLSTGVWGAIERTATALDVVGLALEKRLVRQDIIFERYLEVLIPLWQKVQRPIANRREMKGCGWVFFERLCDRAVQYRKKHYPNREFRSFDPKGPENAVHCPLCETELSPPLAER